MGCRIEFDPTFHTRVCVWDVGSNAILYLPPPLDVGSISILYSGCVGCRIEFDPGSHTPRCRIDFDSTSWGVRDAGSSSLLHFTPRVVWDVRSNAVLHRHPADPGCRIDFHFTSGVCGMLDRIPFYVLGCVGCKIEFDLTFHTRVCVGCRIQCDPTSPPLAGM